MSAARDRETTAAGGQENGFNEAPCGPFYLVVALNICVSALFRLIPEPAKSFAGPDAQPPVGGDIRAMQSKDKPGTLPQAGRGRTPRPSIAGLPVFAVVLALAVLAGCTSTRSEPRPPGRAEGISLEVNNQSRNAVTIYVWSDTYQNRLGMVEALNRDTFNFRWNLAGRVYFLMDFLAQGCVLSEPIDVIDGDELILTVQPIDHRRASRAACRRP